MDTNNPNMDTNDPTVDTTDPTIDTTDPTIDTTDPTIDTTDPNVAWSERTITAECYPDVVGLVVADQDRRDGCIGILPLTAQRHLRAPMCISDVPTSGPQVLLHRFLGQLAETLSQADGSVILVRGRPGEPFLTDGDRAWHEGVLDALGDCRQGLLAAAYLATPGVVRPFPSPMSAADLAC